MSYQQEIRAMLEDVRDERGQPVSFDVTQVRDDSFDMRVSVADSAPPVERIFDLSNGITPRTRRAIAEWAVSLATAAPSQP